MPSAPIPEKEGNDQFSYEFSGWYPEIKEVTGDQTYEATFSPLTNSYMITWVVDDNTTTESYEYGKTPVFKGSTDKAADAQYTYTFTGWSPEITSVTGNATYTATYSKTLNKYTITFVDENGTTVLDTQEVEYGSMPEYAGDTPTKAATDKYTYTFTGWSPEIVAVEGDATYKATYSSVVNEYTITWVDGDGKTLKTEKVAYDEMPSYSGDTPTKKATPQYSYSFNETWSPEIVAVTKDATYTAQFDSTVNKYTITFVNEDGTELQSSEVEYGQTPSYTGETPTKAATAQHTYTFKAWSPEIVAVTGNATYTATYSETVNTYTVTWKNDNGDVLETDENVCHTKIKWRRQ